MSASRSAALPVRFVEPVAEIPLASREAHLAAALGPVLGPVASSAYLVAPRTVVGWGAEWGAERGQTIGAAGDVAPGKRGRP